MSEWEFAQADPEQQLAKLHYFSMCTKQDCGEVEFTITVKEFLTPRDPAMGYFAQADKQTNQGVAPVHADWLGQNTAGGAGAVHARSGTLPVSSLGAAGSIRLSCLAGSRRIGVEEQRRQEAKIT